MFCSKCGTEIYDGVIFCPKCGNPVTPMPVNSSMNVESEEVFNDLFEEDTPKASNGRETHVDTQVEDNKFMAVLSYIGFLVLVPIFGCKDSKFVQYHASQGLSLSVCTFVYSTCSWIITMILGVFFKPSYNFLLGYVPNPLVSIVSIILGLGSILFIVLAIMGIVNAVKGECKMLPVIGKLDLLKKCK